MLNPFDLRGPQFLLFYLCLGAATALVTVWVRRSGEQSAVPVRPLSDYLEIAFLRGGAAEAVRVALLTLIDRGVLALSGTDAVQIPPGVPTGQIIRPTERAIVDRARQTATVAALVADGQVTAAAERECESELIRLGLLPSPQQKAARLSLWLWSGGSLAIIAGIKIVVALARGRTNVQLLVVLTVVFLIVTFLTTHPRLTSAGSALVEDMRTLFAGLKARASALRPRENGQDLALLAAIYGVSAALPVHPDLKRVFPGVSGSGGDSGSSCGSSCGSSSGGSSCGGGGGGCGGCGS